MDNGSSGSSYFREIVHKIDAASAPIVIAEGVCKNIAAILSQNPTSVSFTLKLLFKAIEPSLSRVDAVVAVAVLVDEVVVDAAYAPYAEA